METLAAELQAADRAVVELAAQPSQAIAKVRYTHAAMVDLIISNPGISQNSLAAHFGYSPAWVSRIIASDAFQELVAQRREEIVDPYIKATMQERFAALVIRSLEVLQTKLERPQVSDNVALRAAELGAKALGIGGNAPPPQQPADSLDRLAGRLLALQRAVRPQERTIDGQAETVIDAGG